MELKQTSLSNTALDALSYGKGVNSAKTQQYSKCSTIDMKHVILKDTCAYVPWISKMKAVSQFNSPWI